MARPSLDVCPATGVSPEHGRRRKGGRGVRRETEPQCAAETGKQSAAERQQQIACRKPRTIECHAESPPLVEDFLHSEGLFKQVLSQRSITRCGECCPRRHPYPKAIGIFSVISALGRASFGYQNRLSEAESLCKIRTFGAPVLIPTLCNLTLLA